MKLSNFVNKSHKTTSPGPFIPTLLLVALLALFVCLAAATVDTMPNHYNCCIIGSDCVQSASCVTKNCYCDLSRGMHRDVAGSGPPPPKYDCCTMQGKCVNSTLCATHDCVCSPEDEGTGKVNVGFSPRAGDIFASANPAVDEHPALAVKKRAEDVGDGGEAADE